MKTRSFACVLSLALLAGCATVTFKRGASPGAMAAAEHACRSTSTDESAYAECLRERGWYVTGTGAARGGAGTDAQAVEPRALGNASGAVVSDEDPGRAPVAETAPATAATPSVTTAATPLEASDPMARIGVASWWKLGGSAAGLDRAIDACVGELGPAHQPNPGATLVTAGLRACLYAAGWHSVGESAAR